MRGIYQIRRAFGSGAWLLKEIISAFLDSEVVSSMCTASAGYVDELEFKHSDTEMDSEIYTEFDSLADLIIKDHREYAFQSLVALSGADSELHPNELKVLDYLSNKSINITMLN